MADVIPGRMLGRRPPKRAPALMLAHYLTGLTPEHPLVADHFAEVSDWGIYANDQFGDCGPVSVANQRKLVTRYLAGTEQSVSQDDVFDLYRRSGNPDFDPTTGAGDNGVDMQTMCEALIAGGIAGTKAVGFASVNVGNIDEVRAAIAIFGSLLLGVDLEVAQQQQKAVWDYSPSAEWGGHAVLAGRYHSVAGEDLDVISWGGVIGTSDAFVAHQLQEAWVVIWPEHLGSLGFLAGVNLGALADDYKALTSRDFPLTPVPVPPPAPPSPAPPQGCLPMLGLLPVSLLARLFK